MVTQFYKRILCLSQICLLTALLSLSIINSKAQPILSVTPVISTGLVAPIQFVNAADGTNRVFIVEKGGMIKVYNAAFQLQDTFLTVTGISTGGEQGLLSLAFHPDYETNGFFFVYYVTAGGNLEIARYQVSNNANEANVSSKVVILTIPHPTNSNHNGGELHFGADGFLYLSTGDGGGSGDQSNNAQNTAVLLGKILRLNVNTSLTAPFYTIPAGNPYGNEIFALGLRNPFRWSFDRLTNDMWIGDVGQGLWEEFNFRSAATSVGANYGWRCYEGDATYNTAGCSAMSNYVFPAYVYPNPGGAAVTGGLVYRGTASPAMYGYYIATDFYSGEFFISSPDGNGGFTTSTQTLPPTGIADFGETENGETYLVSLTGGVVYRLDAVEGSPVPVSLVNFSGSVVNRQVQLNWKTLMEQNLEFFDIEFSLDGAAFASAGTVQAQNNATGAEYSFTHITNATGNLFYRLKMKDENGRYRYSGTIRISLTGKEGLFVAPSVISNGVINISLNDATYTSMEVVSTGGNILIKRSIELQTGRVSVPANELTPGIYIVRLVSEKGEVVTQKIVVQ